MMATQGATCDEMLVFPTPSPSLVDDDNPFAFAFAVPNDLPGMTFFAVKATLPHLLTTIR